MRTALKHLGWAAGLAAASSLCFALLRRREMPLRSCCDEHSPSPSQLARSPASDRRPPSPSEPAPAGTGLLDRYLDRVAPAGSERLSWRHPQRIMYWLVALSLLATALACVACVLELRRQSPAPAAGNFDPAHSNPAQQPSPEVQRPWVGLLQSIPPTLSPTGGTFSIKLQNSGKGPAYQVQIRDVIRIENISDEPEFPAIDAAPALAGQMLVPGAEFSTHVGFRTSAPTIAALREGKLQVVNYLQVNYEDLSRRPHVTQQCFYWHPEMPSPLACDKYNQAD